MDFFEHQDRMRRQTRWLLLLFLLAVIAIIAAVDLVVMFAIGAFGEPAGMAALSGPWWGQHGATVAGASVGTAALIGFASLFKTLSLRGGGGEVAQQLGGVLVDVDTRDPLKRRLLNVVEEIAIASGVPVPEVYVLEREPGINAFAAGFSSTDAAIAVTRGTLEKLDRAELQGVIAHEFSHVLNGDMRLNIRLIGFLFGILVLALIGRRVLRHGRHFGRARDKDGAPVLLIALALILIGYVGLFFGRWIKSSVSRSREYLADASAVQFTRDPTGIAGALKMIAVDGNASYLDVDTEEVGHMLFGPGQSMHLFATHPPLLQRIERLEPGFREEHLQDLARRLARKRERLQRVSEREAAAAEVEARRGAATAPDLGGLVGQIGTPDFERLLLAAAVAASLAEPVRRLAQSPDTAPELLLYSLLHDDPESREQQLLAVAEVLGADSEERVRRLADGAAVPTAQQRLPVLELALPSLRRHPPERVRQLLLAVDRMIRVDGRIDAFEYLMARMIRQFLWESANPHRVRAAGHKPLRRRAEETAQLLAVLALHGQRTDRADAEAAFRAGMSAAFGEESAPLSEPEDWVGAMDRALDRLDALEPQAKSRLVQAMLVTVTHDERLVPAELELLRAASAALHVPIPVLSRPGSD